jgi:hypothetical protein
VRSGGYPGLESQPIMDALLSHPRQARSPHLARIRNHSSRLGAELAGLQGQGAGGMAPLAMPHASTGPAAPHPSRSWRRLSPTTPRCLARGALGPSAGTSAAGPSETLCPWLHGAGRRAVTVRRVAPRDWRRSAACCSWRSASRTGPDNAGKGSYVKQRPGIIPGRCRTFS